MMIRAAQPLGACPGGRAPRQNWGKFEAHKWGGFTGRLDNDIAGQQSSYLVFGLKRSISQFWIACSEDNVRTKIEVEPLLEIVLHIDFREHAEIMSLKDLLRRSHGIVKAHVYYFGVMVG